ncbi:hypothetical protein EIP86_006252 [Pleurotus ostreatoroseus]|nr:hypothetical protein EIP86_006252 [Pleurotus ostreatoroseus]
MSRTSSLDPEFIVIIALHSTVDSLKAQYMKEREKAVLARMFSWYQFGAKRRARKQWDEEWGDIDTEGNIWWLGSARKNWEAVMGKHIWQWFLPIGRSPTDGVNWPLNPRFDSEGKWRPRREWPAELQ